MSAAAAETAAPPGRRRLSRAHRWMGPATWYLESDHLLLADQRWCVAEYRRFYYADLNSVTIWPRSRRLWRFAAMPGLAAVLTMLPLYIPAILAGKPMAPLIAGAAVALAVIAAQAVAGPYAGTLIATRYSSYQTPMVHRWSGAKDVLESLAPYIAEAQKGGVEAPATEAPAAEDSLRGAGASAAGTDDSAAAVARNGEG